MFFSIDLDRHFAFSKSMTNRMVICVGKFCYFWRRELRIVDIFCQGVVGIRMVNMDGFLKACCTNRVDGKSV